MPSTEARVQVLRPAAYCVIYDGAGRVLLTEWSRRDVNPKRLGWTLPGGGMEFGESPADAAAREVYEETGFRVELISEPFVQSVHYKVGELQMDAEFQALRFVYRARILGGSLGIVDTGGSTTDVGFFTLHEALEKGLTDSVLVSLQRFPPTLAVSLDHVQLAIPLGGEPLARAFWVDLIGLREVEKPEALRVRGGAHFEAGKLYVHVGIDPDFVPAKKAHPAFRVPDLELLAARLSAGSYPVRWFDEIPGTRRFHTDDPFGNRLEFSE